eukprot:scaffold258416_cov36-Tisochrysis_lutea.AAC.2
MVVHRSASKELELSLSPILKRVVAFWKQVKVWGPIRILTERALPHKVERGANDGRHAAHLHRKPRRLICILAHADDSSARRRAPASLADRRALMRGARRRRDLRATPQAQPSPPSASPPPQTRRSAALHA